MELLFLTSIIKYASCGTNTNQTLHDNANRVSNSAYAHFGYSTDLNGRDEIYRLNVTQSSIVTINLTNTSRNLAMVLFKGSINCTSIGTCNVLLSSVIDVTTSSSEYSDQIGPVQLAPGTYILVIDSKVNQSSNYNLRVNCTPIYTGCVTGTTRLLYDDFQNYQYGPVSHQSYYWLKWFSSSTNDAEVAGNSSNKYLHLVRKSNATTANQPAVLWRFGHRSNTGSYALKMIMWVPQNRSAYFSIQKRLTYQNSNNEYGARMFLEAGGQGRVLIGGNTYAFTYSHNTWMNIQINMNLNLNRTYFYINGVLKASWPSTSYSGGANGTKAIEAIQFYPHASNSQFYVDNLCFSKYN
jgi:hypothetical protein